jgi:hypothetical protein
MTPPYRGGKASGSLALSAITTVIDASGVPLQRLLQKTDNRQLARVLPRANTRCRRTNCVATRQHQQ